MTARLKSIYLASNEYGNELMAEVASEWFASPEGKSDLATVCYVHEHGGWALGYTMIGGRLVIISSANDSALWQGQAKQFRERIRGAEWIYLPETRRGREVA